MINLAEYSFSTRHRIYRDVCLLFLGEPTAVPFSKALLAGLAHENKNFRQHSKYPHLSSMLASVGFLIAVIFCVLVWQKTALPEPSLVQGGEGEETQSSTSVSIPVSSSEALLRDTVRLPLENL